MLISSRIHPNCNIQKRKSQYKYTKKIYSQW